jgi:hypothetical protein
MMIAPDKKQQTAAEVRVQKDTHPTWQQGSLPLAPTSEQRQGGGKSTTLGKF